jgi:ADP-ribosylglycohydrolase
VHWLQEASVKRLFVGSVYEIEAPKTTQKAISLEGDADTLATITGSIAEVFYE